jgi:hypothetical protein
MQNQNLYGSEVKFDSQMNYCNAIMQKIQELQFSLRLGADCTREFSNILALLTDGIKKPIESKMSEIATRHQENIKNIMNMEKFPETFAWSELHKQKYRSVLINKEQSDAIREMIPVVVNRLDEMGLLLNRQNQTQI